MKVICDIVSEARVSATIRRWRQRKYWRRYEMLGSVTTRCSHRRSIDTLAPCDGHCQPCSRRGPLAHSRNFGPHGSPSDPNRGGISLGKRIACYFVFRLLLLKLTVVCRRSAKRRWRHVRLLVARLIELDHVMRRVRSQIGAYWILRWIALITLDW